MDLLEPRVGELLDRIAEGPPPPGGGSVAALAGAMAAGLVTMAARSAGDLAAAAQAETLRSRLSELAEEDAAALAHALASLDGELEPTSAEARDFWLGRALARAADAPLRIAEAAEDVAALAAELAARIESPVKPDVAAAATLAEAAARIAAQLVAVNLATLEGDERLARARTAAESASESARRATK